MKEIMPGVFAIDLRDSDWPDQLEEAITGFKKPASPCLYHVKTSECPWRQAGQCQCVERSEKLGGASS